MIDNRSLVAGNIPTDSFESPSSANPSDIVLSVESVSKRFCRDLKRSMYYGVKDMVSEIVGKPTQKHVLRKKEFWALQDVSFELKKGQAVGLIGANGAGKTTLLKIISGLIKPDTGRVMVKGKLAPLIALGAGFNPVLSGRENVFINMSILGLSQKEIEQRYDEVVAFSEIGYAIDAPVSTYSSGMGARLGFSCAIHAVPDILLIDEVLAVGDIKFRMKCYRRLAQLREQGVSFVLVSHSVQSLLSICESGVYLSKGQLIAAGDISSVLYRYEDDLFSNPTQRLEGRLLLPTKSPSETLGLDIVEVFFTTEDSQCTSELISGRSAVLNIVCKAHQFIEFFYLRVIIRELAQENTYAITLNSADDGHMYSAEPGLKKISMNLPSVGLKRGLYNAKISLGQSGGLFFDVAETYEFIVKSVTKDMIDSVYYQQREWA